MRGNPATELGSGCLGRHGACDWVECTTDGAGDGCGAGAGVESASDGEEEVCVPVSDGAMQNYHMAFFGKCRGTINGQFFLPRGD